MPLKDKGFVIWIILTFVLVIVLTTKSDQIKGLLTNQPNNPFKPSEVFTKRDNQYAVSAGHPLAVKEGMDVLARGGNALDAAITVSYVLSVVQPFASGIGGGGVMLIHPQNSQRPIVYEYQATSPANGRIPKNYIGVPGLVKAMEQAHSDFGTIELSQLIEPAIQLADNGYRADKVLQSVLASQRYKIKDQEALNLFFPNGNPIKVGALLKQPVLAATLREIQAKGAAVFYQGKIADKVTKATGLHKTDLSNYKVLKKEPVSGKYRDYEIFSAPPPFSGITVIQIMQLAERLEVDSFKENEKNIRIYCDIVNEAYRKRSRDLADPGFMRVNYEYLLSESYINEMINNISSGQGFSPEDTTDEEIEDTTAFVIVDKNGMMVSCTNSLSSWFGSGQYVGGFFLNNHLGNLNFIETNINYWRGGKHPRSYIAPTIIVKEGRPILGIGTPGGRKIPILITQTLFNILSDKENLQKAIDNPKFYLMQNQLYTEGDLLSDDTKRILLQNGYQVINNNTPLSYGALNCLYYDHTSGKVYGGSDLRRGGTWKLGTVAQD